HYSAALEAALGNMADPAAVVNVNSGALTVAGGTGTLRATLVRFADNLELGGSLVLQHGRVQFTGITDAIIGGIYSGTFAAASCIAGFRVTTLTSAPILSAFVNGTAVGGALTTRFDRASF